MISLSDWHEVIYDSNCILLKLWTTQNVKKNLSARKNTHPK